MKQPVLFYCTMPSAERGFTGANIGNAVTYRLLSEYFDITVIDTGSKFFNPYGKSFNHFVYNIKIFLHYIKKYWVLYKTVKNNKFKFFYFLPASSPSGHFRDLLTLLIVRPRVEKIIGHIRNGNFYEINNRKWHRHLTARFVNKMDAFIFLSDELKKSCSNFLPATKTFVAFNPIDDDIVCTRDEVREKITKRAEGRKLNILFLSNMIASKGYIDVAKAAVLLKKTSNISFTVHLAGRWNSANDELVMKQFIADNNITENVIVHGKITDRLKIKQLLLESDLFILPTYYPVEAQPRSIIEAINAATPVIATRHASIPEMIEDGHDGILVNKHSPQEIANAILILNDVSAWQNMALHCRRTYENKFSEFAVKAQLLHAFS